LVWWSVEVPTVVDDLAMSQTKLPRNRRPTLSGRRSRWGPEEERSRKELTQMMKMIGDHLDPGVGGATQVL
jgi:hypothetical protein